MNDATRKPRLTKSRLTTAHQCLKRLHLTAHQPGAGVFSQKTLQAFKNGEAVGEIARQIYGTTESIEIPLRHDRDAMVRETADLLELGADSPIFEATFEHAGVLVRVDVLIPDGDGWRAVEIKASTKVKPEHRVDCAIQWWVMNGAGLRISAIALGHVNNQFVYGGDGDYRGLITEVDITEKAETLAAAVAELAKNASAAVTGPMPDIQVGAHCNKPYECEFRRLCWRLDAEYPVSGLGGSKAKQAQWVSRGITDLRDVPAEEITERKPKRVHRVTCAGEPELLPGAREKLEAVGYPRYYLDFETIAPAIPIWRGTKPYMAVPVQWSIHIDDGTGDGALESMRHEEFLDLSGEPPMRKLAKRMIECLGDAGPVFMYTDYEKRVIKTLMELFPDLEGPLQGVVDRLVDLAKIVEEHYYDPSMLGSWSVKCVAPAMAPHMNYAALEGINVGTAASDGYLEAINPETTPQRKAELEEQLLRYCRFDTEAMVEIAKFLAT